MYKIRTIRREEHWIETDSGNYLGCYLGDKVLIISLIDFHNANEARKLAREGKLITPSAEESLFTSSPLIPSSFTVRDVTTDRDDDNPFDPQDTGEKDE